MSRSTRYLTFEGQFESRATNCSLSSITEHSFHGITPSQKTGGSVTRVSGTMCYLCLRPLTRDFWFFVYSTVDDFVDGQILQVQQVHQRQAGRVENFLN
jgi:hypothetical protein